MRGIGFLCTLWTLLPSQLQHKAHSHEAGAPAWPYLDLRSDDRSLHLCHVIRSVVQRLALSYRLLQVGQFFLLFLSVQTSTFCSIFPSSPPASRATRASSLVTLRRTEPQRSQVAGWLSARERSYEPNHALRCCKLQRPHADNFVRLNESKDC